MANTWQPNISKKIFITGGDDVQNNTLATYLSENASEVSTTMFNLASLQTPLSVGSHTIRVKAKAAGYVDSAFSNSLIYAVYVQLDTPIVVLSGSTLSVTAVSHANGFEVYANDVLQTTRPFVLGTSFNLDTLNLPTGTYTIKVRCVDNAIGSYYTPSEFATASNSYVVLPQLDAPTNVSVSGTDATFDEVSNAESYEFFVDGTSIGTYTPASGYTIDYSVGKKPDTIDITYANNTTATVGAGIYEHVKSIDSINYNDINDRTYTIDGITEPPLPYVLTANATVYSYSACFAEGTKILLADGTEKNIENITHDDELVVWDFYEGKLSTAKPIWILDGGKCSFYYKAILSDGTEMKLCGPVGHRLFNITKQQMLYCVDCVGDEVCKADGSIVTVLSCEKVQETVNYYNLTTDKYLDCFAEGVLTGSRLNNMYHISDMKYDSDERLISEEEEKERWAVRGMEVPK